MTSLTRITVTYCSAVLQGKEEEAMEINAKARDPREHVNEEPRNDLGDLMTGFFGMTGFMTLVFFGMVIVKFVFLD